MLRTILLPGLMAISFAACQTANRPAEFTTAEEAIERAEDADLDNSMPRAMELAEQKFKQAKNSLKKSDDALKDGDSAKAQDLRQEAISLANEAAAIANTGLNLRDQVKAFDSNLEAQDGDVQALMSENRNLRNQIEQLRTQVAQAQGLQEFEMGKTVAFFETDSAEISDNFAQEISKVAETLKAHPELYLTLEGFADPRGPEEYNQKLSEQRAQAVMQKFVDEGIAAERIRMAGKGAISDTPKSNLAELQLDRKVVATFSTVAH